MLDPRRGPQQQRPERASLCAGESSANLCATARFVERREDVLLGVTLILIMQPPGRISEVAAA